MFSFRAETACAGPGSALDARRAHTVPAIGASYLPDGRARAGDEAPRRLGFETASSALEAASHTMREGKSSKKGAAPPEGDGMGAQEEQDGAMGKNGGARPSRRYGVRLDFGDARVPWLARPRAACASDCSWTVRLRCARECVKLLRRYLLFTRLLAFCPPRSWSMEQRLQHRIACKSKSKLSLGQKLQIVAQHQSRDPAIRKTQVSSAPLCHTRC